jgi:PilZ domain-containing protein
MFGSSVSDPYSKQRRSPRFPFDSLVHVTTFRIGEEAPLWGRSTDLCRDGIGVTVAGDLTPEELVAIQIPLPAAQSVTVSASVRYCNQGHCGFGFFDLHDQQRKAIQAACEKLRNVSGRM